MIIFLKKNFIAHDFERKTPIRKKPGPKPGAFHALGYTGQSLRDQIDFALTQALQGGRCDRILVLDDLDCLDMERKRKRQSFNETIEHIPGSAGIEWIVSFAAPEIEAWLVADWSQSFAADLDLRHFHVQIRRALAAAYQRSTEAGDIGNPENFSELNVDRGACQQKLSEEIAEVVYRIAGITYSKDEHSGSMLQRVRAETIQQNCPIFRQTLFIPLKTRIENE